MSGVRHIKVRRTTFGPEDDRLDREFWAASTPDERVAETWRLTVEQWELKGWDPRESRVQRTVERVVHQDALGRPRDLADLESLEGGS
jgi:hypothetical protein